MLFLLLSNRQQFSPSFLFHTLVLLRNILPLPLYNVQFWTILDISRFFSLPHSFFSYLFLPSSPSLLLYSPSHSHFFLYFFLILFCYKRENRKIDKIDDDPFHSKVLQVQKFVFQSTNVNLSRASNTPQKKSQNKFLGIYSECSSSCVS